MNESNFTKEQNDSRKNVIANIEKLDAFQVCKLEGIVIGMMMKEEA